MSTDADSDEATHAWSLESATTTLCGRPVARKRMESSFQPIDCDHCELLRSLSATLSLVTKGSGSASAR
jgi:hypothetical protein